MCEKWKRNCAPVRGAERSYARLMFSFACQKRTRKAPATFEAREATGCGSQRLLRYRSHPAGRCPNSSSLYPPQAAVVAVARKGLLAPFRPRRSCRSTKMLAASLNAFFALLRFTAPPMVLRFRRTLRSARAQSLLQSSKWEKREKSATATTAACGGYREELLGPRSAGHECRSRHEVDAGHRNPS